MPPKPTVKDGDQIYRLRVVATIMRDVGIRKKNGKEYPRRERFAIVDCECGKRLEVTANNLRTGNTRSCGCAARDPDAPDPVPRQPHVLRDHPLYKTWQGMRQRCSNKNHVSYHIYGGRGIWVCDAWQDDHVAFIEWGEANGHRSGLSLDRIDNDGGYEPSNCRWADPLTQAENTRKAAAIEAFGEVKTYRAWSRDPRCEVPYHTFRYRVAEKGMAPALAMKKGDYIPEAERPQWWL